MQLSISRDPYRQESCFKFIVRDTELPKEPSDILAVLKITTETDTRKLETRFLGDIAIAISDLHFEATNA